MIYLDANVMIFLVEGDDATREPIENRLMPYIGIYNSLATSALSRLECRTKPIRENDSETLRLFDDFFESDELRLFNISLTIIEKATELRAQYRFKTPDAIHLATAIVEGCSAFYTGDQELSRCQEITVVLI